jgi:MFS transporter, DHA1 family, inner membrane transport protein
LVTGEPQRVSSFEAPARVAYVNALFIIGTLGTLITPALLAAWARLHWSQTRLGLVAAVELATLAAGSLSGLYWQRRWNWRSVTVAALLLAVLANVTCVASVNFATVCAARGAAGLAGGLLCAVYSAFLANTKSPSRMIALTTFVQIGVEAALILSSSSVFDGFGSAGLFGLMAALLLLLVVPVRILPGGWPAEAMASSPDAVAGTASWRGYPLLLSFVPFVVVQTGVYTFLGDFGRLAAHLPMDQTLRAIAISVVLSSLGSVAAYVLNDRGGLLLPIGGAIVIMMATICSMILAPHSLALFVASIGLLQIAWIFLNCYLYSALIEANNLLVPAATPLASFGSAFGASAMGYVLEHDGLRGALCLSIGALGLTAFLTIPFLGRDRALGEPVR